MKAYREDEGKCIAQVLMTFWGVRRTFPITLYSNVHVSTVFPTKLASTHGIFVSVLRETTIEFFLQTLAAYDSHTERIKNEKLPLQNKKRVRIFSDFYCADCTFPWKSNHIWFYMKNIFCFFSHQLYFRYFKYTFVFSVNFR